MTKNLPKVGTKCIVITESDEVFVGVRIEHAVRMKRTKGEPKPADFCDRRGKTIENVTHWRYMPQKFDACTVEISPK